MTPDTAQSVRCSVSNCSCVCFKPANGKFRSCDCCGHGWVVHALEKLQAHPTSSCGPVEVALPGLVFDLSSLVLYGAQAVPVRLKILLDRLFSILSPEQVAHILHTHGWSLADYVRGYILQHPSGKVLDRWMMATPEEELLIFKQFLRFGETRPIVELMRPQCLMGVAAASDAEPAPAPLSRRSHNAGSLKAFRSSTEDPHAVSGAWRVEKIGDGGGDTMQHFENLPGGLSLLLPRFSDSTFPCSVPPAEDLVPSQYRYLRYRPDGDRGVHHSDPVRKKFKAGSRRGRVCCGVCGKSFYDKGTLKIHYNAVHLKVKHRCTVAGCTMVFSSLRSRNRHSANPNPRLHTDSNRDTHAQNNNTQSEGQPQDKVICNTLRPQDNDERVHNLRYGYNFPPKTDSFTQCDATYRMTLHPQGVPQSTTSSVAPSLVSAHLHLLVPVTEKRLLSISTEGEVATATCRRPDGRMDDQRRSTNCIAKKKPRKSSTPVKIERERKNQEEEESRMHLH